MILDGAKEIRTWRSTGEGTTGRDVEGRRGSARLARVPAVVRSGAISHLSPVPQLQLFSLHSAHLCSLCSQAQFKQYLLQVVFSKDPSPPSVPSPLRLRDTFGFSTHGAFQPGLPTCGNLCTRFTLSHSLWSTPALL